MQRADKITLKLLDETISDGALSKGLKCFLHWIFMEGKERLFEDQNQGKVFFDRRIGKSKYHNFRGLKIHCEFVDRGKSLGLSKK
jgi:hypothetical protein